MEDSNEESRKQQQICMGLFFQLVEYIIELSAQPDLRGNENEAISLDSNIPRIFELLSNWLESEICGSAAVNLLDTLVRLAKKESVAPRIARDPSIVIQLLITVSEKPDNSALHTAAVLQLLVSLLHQTKTEKLILSKITESFFDKILSPLLHIKSEVSENRLSIEEIEKFIFCLLLLINFTQIAKKAYVEKCCTLLQLRPIQHALARAMISNSSRLCGAVFQISQFEHFPQKEVAKELEEHLHSLIEVITQAQNNNQSETLKINEKRLAVKVSEMIVLQKEYNDIKEELYTKTEELEKLHTAAKENVTKCPNAIMCILIL